MTRTASLDHLRTALAAQAADAATELFSCRSCTKQVCKWGGTQSTAALISDPPPSCMLARQHPHNCCLGSNSPAWGDHPASQAQQTRPCLLQGRLPHTLWTTPDTTMLVRGRPASWTSCTGLRAAAESSCRRLSIAAIRQALNLQHREAGALLIGVPWGWTVPAGTAITRWVGRRCALYLSSTKQSSPASPCSPASHKPPLAIMVQ